MACKECGECCVKLVFPMVGSGQWFTDFTEFVNSTRPGLMELKDGILRLMVPCVHLKDHRCSVYEERPVICKNFLCKKARGE